MAQTTEEVLKDLKQKVQDGTVIIGAERVLKALRTGKLGTIFAAKNCSEKILGDIKYYANLVNVPVKKLDLSNEELGVFCKKNYFVSVLGTLGE